MKKKILKILGILVILTIIIFICVNIKKMFESGKQEIHVTTAKNYIAGSEL